MSKLVLIVVVQLIFVPLLTLRTITMVKNLKVLTAVFGFLEALVYIFGLAIVLSGESTYMEMFVYAVGFSAGLIAGISVEQKLAIGYSTFMVNINHRNDEMVKALRDSGYGVTLFSGEGRDSDRVKLEILTKRKKEATLLKIIKTFEPNAFIISYEPKTFHGGYISDIMKKRMQKRRNGAQVVGSTASFIGRSIKEIRFELKTLSRAWKSK